MGLEDQTGSAGSAALPPGRPEERIGDWKPLYDEAGAIAESTRCLYCEDAPCIKACPTAINIPEFIRKIGTGNRKGAARTIITANILGYSCSRVCPVEELCAGSCVYNHLDQPPIAIGRLQRYATEPIMNAGGFAGLLPEPKAPTGKRVALVGAGPASLAAAALLRVEGHAAVIFEKDPFAGGLNTTGIAPYKMEAPASLAEAAWVLALGVELRSGVAVGRDVSPESLLSDFDAVFLGLGIGGDKGLGLDSEQGAGVVGATDLIRRIKTDPSLDLSGVRRALIVGGGNTGLDIAHELALLGVGDVTMVYRKGEAEMSGYAHELAAARKHGVRFLGWRAPLGVVRDAGGAATGLRVRGPEGEEVLPTDLVVLAVGQDRGTAALAASFTGVRTDSSGRVLVDPATHRTGNPKVWAGGDCVNGGKEVVNAAAEAKIAVRDMHRALTGGV